MIIELNSRGDALENQADGISSSPLPKISTVSWLIAELPWYQSNNTQVRNKIASQIIFKIFIQYSLNSCIINAVYPATSNSDLKLFIYYASEARTHVRRGIDWLNGNALGPRPVYTRWRVRWVSDSQCVVSSFVCQYFY